MTKRAQDIWFGIGATILVLAFSSLLVMAGVAMILRQLAR